MTNKEQFIKFAENSLKHKEISLNDQINGMVNRLESLLKEVKNIAESDFYNLSDKAGRILHETQYAVVNLNIDGIIRTVAEYQAAEARMETIKELESEE